MNEPLIPSVAEGFIRIRGEVAYDGKDFSGWGFQNDRRTVQGDIEEALAQILRTERTIIQCAGRTDAGVHATGQVMHLDIPVAWSDRLADLAYKVNAILAEDVVIKSLVHTAQDFDARFAALSRSYTYYIEEGLRNPITRDRVFQHPRYLDVEAIHEASQVLLGLHDYSAFCKRSDSGTSIRTLQRFDWSRTADGLIRVDIKADAFCYSMVRALVGAVLPIGEGKKDKAWLKAYLDGGVKDPAVFMAPGHALTLVEVEYPEESKYSSRIRTTLNSRDNDPILDEETTQ